MFNSSLRLRSGMARTCQYVERGHSRASSNSLNDIALLLLFVDPVAIAVSFIRSFKAEIQGKDSELIYGSTLNFM
jgi:hypothetical protein